MGYVSIFDSPISSPPAKVEGYVSIFSADAPAPIQVQPGSSGGPFGFFGNLLGGMKDLATGLAGIAGAGVHDIGRGLGQIIPGRQDWGVIADNPADSYRIDDIALALPGAIASDFARRYGPLFRGDLAEFGSQLYEQPLAFGLDVLGAGSLAATGARLGAKAALRGTAAAGTAESIAEKLRLAGAGKGAVAAGLRGGLEELAQAAPLSPSASLARAILPKAGERLVGERLLPFAPSSNPVVRGIVSNPATRPFTSQPAVAGSLAQARLWSQARKVLGEASSTFIRARETRLRAVQDVLSPYMRDATFADRAHGAFMGLDVDVAGLTPDDIARQIPVRHFINKGTLPIMGGATSDFDRLAQFVSSSDTPLYIRWTTRPIADDMAHGVSINFVTGQAESGISVGHASVPTDYPMDQATFLAMNLRDYSFYAQQGGDAYLVRGHLVGRGADGEPLLRDMQPVMRLPRSVVAEAIERDRTSQLAKLDETIAAGEGQTWGPAAYRARQAKGSRYLHDTRAAWLDEWIQKDPDPHWPIMGAAPIEVDLAPEIRTAAERALPLMTKRVDDLASRIRASVGDVSDTDATDRYVSGLYDSLRRRVAHEREGSLDDVTRAQDDVRLMLAEWQQELIERFGWTPEQIMERSYRPLAMKYGLELKKGEWVGGPTWRSLDDAFRAAEIPQPIYFPFMDPAKFRFSDFLQGKARIGAVAASRDPNMRLMSGSLFRKGNYATDPMEVYTRRAARATRAEETWNLIEQVRLRFGRRISSLDDLTDAEVVLAPQGLLRFYKGKLQFEDVFDDLLSRGDDVDPAMAEPLRQVMDMSHGDLDALASWVGVTKKGLELYAIPKVVGRQMDAYARWTGAVSSPGVRLFWDKPSDVWRGLVLSGSPRWVLNNTLGNTIFLKMQGARVRDVAALAEARIRRWWRLRRGDVTEPELLRALDELTGIREVGSGFSSKESLYTPHLGSAEQTVTGQAYRVLAGTRGVQAAKRAGGFMRRLNGAIEETFRQASYIKALERQQLTATARVLWGTKARIERLAKGGITEGQAKAALAEVNRFLGDYGALGPLERNVIRRFMVPFYGFYKHQAKLLLTFPVEHPGRASISRMLAELHREMVEQYGPVPEWLEGATAFGPPGAAGPIPFFTARGPNPFSASFEPFTSGLHPALKVALERASGKNLFTGEPFSDPDVIRPYGTDQAFQIIRDAQGNPVDVVPLADQPLPGFLEHLLQQVPQYEMAEEAIAGGKTYDTSTLLDALAGNAAIVDPATGQPKYPTGFPQQLLKLAGLGLTPYDLQRYQDRLLQLQRAALTQATNQGAY